MTTLNQILFDAQIELGLNLERVSAGARGDIIRLLQGLERELQAKVASGVTDWQKARIAKMLSEAKAAVRAAYDQAAGMAIDTTSAVAQLSASMTAQALTMATGGVVAGVLPTPSYLESLASTALVQGAAQRDWWARQADDLTWRFSSQMRQGLIAGETNQQLIARIRSIMDVSRRNAEALVRTSVQTVAADAREKTFSSNSDLVKAKEWVAALDARTCIQCGALDGKRWDVDGNPIGHSVPYAKPPIHFNDRCSIVPILKTWEELGIDMAEVPESARASMDGQVQDKTFADWLKRQPVERIESVLGKGRAKLWRDGKITFNDLVDGRGSPLTLSELAKIN